MFDLILHYWKKILLHLKLIFTEELIYSKQTEAYDVMPWHVFDYIHEVYI